MADQTHIQRLRGNTAQNNNYTGMDGELTINTDSNSLRIHDGSTQGGHGTVYAASSDTEVYAAMEDLAEKALIIVGTEPPYKLMQKVNGQLVERKLTANGDVYTAHSISEDETLELVQLMPDGGIIIERIGDANPVLKQVVGGELAATELHGKQATYTENADETDSIIDDLEEGALIVEGPGPLVVQSVPTVSEVDGNTLEIKDDGLYGYRSAYHTADENETNAIAADAPDGSLFIEGDGAIAVEVTDPDAVHKTGDETVDGEKTFTSTVNVPGRTGVKSVDAQDSADVNPQSVVQMRVIQAQDNTGKSFSTISRFHLTNGDYQTGLHSYRMVDGIAKEVSIAAVQSPDGTGKVVLSNGPTANDNSNAVATTGWVRNNIDANVVHKTGNEEAAGRKTFTDGVTSRAEYSFFHKTYDENDWETHQECNEFKTYSKNNNSAFDIREIGDKGAHYTRILRTTRFSDGAAINSYLMLGALADKTPYIRISCEPPADSNGSDIATTHWVRENFFMPVTTDISSQFDISQGVIVMCVSGNMVNIILRDVIFNNASANQYIFTRVTVPQPALNYNQYFTCCQADKVFDGFVWVDCDRAHTISLRTGAVVNRGIWGNVTYFTA